MTGGSFKIVSNWAVLTPASLVPHRHPRTKGHAAGGWSSVSVAAMETMHRESTRFGMTPIDRVIELNEK